jgi:hypothetical protein
MNKVEPPPAPNSSSETSQLRDKEPQVVLNPPVDLTDGRKVQIRPAPPAQMSQNHDGNRIGGKIVTLTLTHVVRLALAAALCPTFEPVSGRIGLRFPPFSFSRAP